MKKFFKIRLAEQKDLNGVAVELSAQARRDKKDITTRLDDLEKRVDAIEKTGAARLTEIKGIFRHIMPYLPVKQNPLYRDFHNKKLSKAQGD